MHFGFESWYFWKSDKKNKKNEQSDEASGVFLALKSTSQFLSQSTMSCMPDSRSEANWRCSHKSEAQ